MIILTDTTKILFDHPVYVDKLPFRLKTEKSSSKEISVKMENSDLEISLIEKGSVDGEIWFDVKHWFDISIK